MTKLSTAGERVLTSKNFTTHTRIYINDVLQLDTSTQVVLAPVVNYQINRSRKLGAAKLAMTISNVGGRFSYLRSEDPVFGYGNGIRLEEGLQVGDQIEWFVRFTGIIVRQVATNSGGMPALQVAALDRMKLLLDYLPDEVLYRPTLTLVKGETLISQGDSFQHYRGAREHLPWADIPYPIFYKNGTKVKENYEIDLINGEVYFGEQMWNPTWSQAIRESDAVYRGPGTIPEKPIVSRSFKLVRYGEQLSEHAFDYMELPKDVTFYCKDNKIHFNKDPFCDLIAGRDWQYLDQKILVTLQAVNAVTTDYWYYNSQTNQGEEVIRDIALQAGFKEEQIQLEPTGVSLKTLRFDSLSVKNGFEMLQKVKQQLSPNYIVTCDAAGNLRGYYASQMTVADYPLELIKKIEAPISEESLYTSVVTHGITLNPNDLARTATGTHLLSSKASGAPAAVFNKSFEDQITWHWVQKNNDKPPEFPMDLLRIDLKEKKKIEEINILVGDYKKGTIDQTLSVMVSEDGENWFYVDRESRGLRGASSQWVSVKGGELEYREVTAIKIRVENAYNWTETETITKQRGSWYNRKMSVTTNNYYHWFAAMKEVQIWEKKNLLVTSTLANYLGTGDGTEEYFCFPNTPLIAGAERLYINGEEISNAAYRVNYETGEVKFQYAPIGIITSDYSVIIKEHALTQPDFDTRYLNNVTIATPPGTMVFKGGNIQRGGTAYRLLDKIGLKKIGIPTDNYLNTMVMVQKRGEEFLQEITRLEETLSIDAIYRPDVDICQTIYVFDPLLGITGHYFIEEITEGKEGYRPTLNLKVSKYSLT